MATITVILPAAGRSTRFGQSRNKLIEPLAGLPVIARSALAFARRRDVDFILVPTRDPDAIGAALRASPELAGKLRKTIELVPGGDTREESVRLGLQFATQEMVAIHDAARPLVSQELIDRTIAAAVEHGAAVPAIPVNATIKQSAGALPARVEKTIPRDRLWSIQTPQIMRRENLAHAFDARTVPLDRITDDAQLLELAGHEVWLVAGEESNLKITTAHDLRIAEMILKG